MLHSTLVIEDSHGKWPIVSHYNLGKLQYFTNLNLKAIWG